MSTYPNADVVICPTGVGIRLGRLIRDLRSRACNVGRASRTCRTRGGSAGLALSSSFPKCETLQCRGESSERESDAQVRTPRSKICVASRCQVPNVGRNWKEKEVLGRREEPGPTGRCTRLSKMRGRGTKASAISARGGVLGGGLSWFLDPRQLPGSALVKIAPVFISTLMHVRTVPTSRAGSASRPPRLAAWEW